MKKITVIFLFGLYLFASTEAHQLLKVPILVSHFIQHQKEDKHITLLAFLKMHYAEKVIFDDDYAQDMQLPFKAHSEDFCLSIMPTLPTPKFEMGIVATPVVKQSIPIINDAAYSFLSTQDIFQPPKTV